VKPATRKRILAALDRFNIEVPSWGFADTGTRFGKFHQPAAASTTEEKFEDAGLVHALTGCCPTVAVHVLWDFEPAANSKDHTAAAKATARLARKHGTKVGSINPNVFQDQQYKLGSFCSPDEQARKDALKHTMDSIEIGKATGSKHLSMWLADGTNYPGQDSIVRRKQELESAFKKVSKKMASTWRGSTLLVEYKPFEPAFYHTDIADWGMAMNLAKKAGPNGKVLVDTGHHLPGCNIEHIVAYLLDEDMLGGFHFNDRKYADDDLTLGSIDPYAVFRIFDQIAQFEHDKQKEPGSSKIAYMVDQSHNLKPKLEAMVQTVCEAQKLFAKAHAVDRKALAKAQAAGDITAAEGVLKEAFDLDVTPALEQWRKKAGVPQNPLKELRTSNAIKDRAKARTKAREERGEVVGGGGYA